MTDNSNQYLRKLKSHNSGANESNYTKQDELASTKDFDHNSKSEKALYTHNFSAPTNNEDNANNPYREDGSQDFLYQQ